MNVINHLSNADFYTPSPSGGDGVAAGPVGVSAGDGISMQDNLSPVVAADPAVLPDWNQIANQADADQLQEADALVADAYSQVLGGDRNYAQAEMAQASAIRQSVADDLDARYPAQIEYGFDVSAGGEVLYADYEEQLGFRLIQSDNPTDQSNGSSDLSFESLVFQSFETGLRG
jgi:hypothetical protein